MPEMLEDKKMKRGDIQYQYTDNLVAIKWYDYRGANLIGTALEGCDEVSSVLHRNRDNSKFPIPCPKMVKEYNNNMGGVDLMDQKTAAYKLDRKASSGRYYLRLFFDLMDIACVNAHAVYKALDGPAGL